MLGSEEHDLFAELAAFSGGFTLPDAEAVASVPDTLQGVQDLHRRALLRSVTLGKGRTRYFMLETMRCQAAEKLSAMPDGGIGVRTRHARHYAKIAESHAAALHTAEECEAITAASRDLANFRAALDFAAGHSEQVRTDGIRLSLSLGRLLERLGAFNEAGQCLQTGVKMAESGVEITCELRAGLLLQRAEAHFDAFEWEEARRQALAARNVYGQLDGEMAEAGCAEAENLLGLICLRGPKQLRTARQHFSKARQGFIQAGRRVGEAVTLNNLGLVSHAAGETDTARCHWLAAYDIHCATGYERGMAEALRNLGVLEQEEGQTEAAWKHHRKALDFEISLRHQFGVARALCHLGEIAATGEDKELAAKCLAGAAVLFERAGSPYAREAKDLLDKVAGKGNEKWALKAEEWDVPHLMHWVGLDEDED